MEISYNLDYTTLTLRFSEPLTLGSGRVHISYDGILNGDMAGFYKSSYTDADGKKQIMASTQFESLDARRAFPCWDEVRKPKSFYIHTITSTTITTTTTTTTTTITPMII